MKKNLRTARSVLIICGVGNSSVNLFLDWAFFRGWWKLERQ
jgi:hypothetical protein